MKKKFEEPERRQLVGATPPWVEDPLRR